MDLHPGNDVSTQPGLLYSLTITCHPRVVFMQGRSWPLELYQVQRNQLTSTPFYGLLFLSSLSLQKGCEHLISSKQNYFCFMHTSFLFSVIFLLSPSSCT